jgi:prepilin-type processing-associated H-X9-DG protein
MIRSRRSTIRSRQRHALVMCATVLLQSFAVPVFAQQAMAQGASADLSEALRGTGVPQSIKASALTAQWRSFAPNAGQADLFSALSHQRMPAQPPYYTQGETLRAGNETYLIAYRKTPDAPLTRREMMMDDDGDGIPNTQEEGTKRLRPADVLTLSLLNLRTIGDLNDVRAFNPAKDVLSAAEVKKEASLQDTEGSTRNLKQIGLGVMQYIQDYDEKFPPMRSAQSKAEIAAPQGRLITVQQAIQPYVKSTEIFVHPTTKQLYVPNIALSGVNLSAIEEPARTVSFWEKKPAADGRRAVLYADGHVKRELETEWPKIMARSNRLVPPKKWKPVTKQKQRLPNRFGKAIKTRMIQGMKVEDIRIGKGKEVKKGTSVSVDYRGFLQDGKMFDESYKRGPFETTIPGQVIEGWNLGLVGMKVGGKRRLTIPSKLAYGDEGVRGTIPPKATLVFEVELRKVS